MIMHYYPPVFKAMALHSPNQYQLLQASDYSQGTIRHDATVSQFIVYNSDLVHVMSVTVIVI